MIAWNKICQTKDNGGLEAKDIQAMNIACLIKLAWKISINLEDLQIKVLRGIYERDGGWDPKPIV